MLNQTIIVGRLTKDPEIRDWKWKKKNSNYSGCRKII
jgi:single-stranded DNA-binding protein